MQIRIKGSGGENDFLLGVVYISPIESTYTTNVLINQFRTWEILTEELANFRSEYRIGLIGDLNVRTGLLSYLVVNDDDQFSNNLQTDYLPDQELIKRNNCDAVVNTFGRKLSELCKIAGVRIINGRKFGDSMGKKRPVTDGMVADRQTIL